MNDLNSQSSLLDKPEGKSKRFASTLSKQSYNEISKQKTKWLDDMFPASEHSIYSGKTNFSNYTGPSSIPHGLNVNQILIFN